MRRTRLSAYACAVACGTVAAAIGPAQDEYDLSWSTTGGGGGFSFNDEFTLDATIGQSDATTSEGLTGGDWAMTGGFLAVTVTFSCPGDVDGDGVIAFTDLVMVLADWGICPGCPTDVNGDGAVDFSDLLVVLAGWGPC